MDVEEAVLVKIARVAGMEEAVAHGVLRRVLAVPVALHHEAGLDDDLADLSGRHGLALPVDDAHDRARPGHAAGAQLAPGGIMRLGRQEGAGAHRLRQPVELREARIHDLHCRAQQRLGDRRGAVEHLLQAGEIHLADIFLLRQHQDHRRHPEGVGNLVLGDQLQDQLRINIAQDDRLGALQRGQHADIDARHMELRHRVHHRLARIIARPFKHAGLREEGAVIVIGQLHAFRQAGGAGGVELDDIIIAAHREARICHRLRAAPGGVEIPVLAVTVERDDAFQVRQLGLDLVDHGVEFLADEQHLGARVRQDELHFRRGEARVDAVHHRARLGGAEQHLVIDVGILREIADPVPRLDAEREEAVGDLVGTGLEIAVAGRLALEPERGFIRAPLRLHARNVCQVRHRLNVDHRFLHSLCG